ncbi:hypothetical protein PGLA_23815 [Paenibacillus glacialis]|uniref:DUF4190 domain-containing protein n=1 Tax=Paenibacillus glacialis TaxID=494026 RepID=A0A168DI07_9BACL|nr:hypothetical protein PGLA_23815 [Paenibacillus glacialis]
MRKERILHAKRVDYPRLNHDHNEEFGEEYAAEIAPAPSGISNDDDADIMESRTGQMAGYVGLAFGVISLFMWSIVLGPVAAIIGYYAFSQGNKATGGWSMALGILATISYFVLMPFTR